MKFFLLKMILTFHFLLKMILTFQDYILVYSLMMTCGSLTTTLGALTMTFGSLTTTFGSQTKMMVALIGTRIQNMTLVTWTKKHTNYFRSLRDQFTQDSGTYPMKL